MTGVNVYVPLPIEQSRKMKIASANLFQPRIMYYAVFLFEQAGISSTRGSLLANGIQGAVLNIFTWPNMYWMDTWGRRTPMVIGGFGMAISMMLIGTIMKTKGEYRGCVSKDLDID